MRQETAQLIAEDRDARGLEPHHRRAAPDFLAQDLEDLPQLRARQVEHAEVVERPAAAEALGLDDDLESRVLEHLDRGPRHFGTEEVVEGVRPEQHALAASGPRPRLEPGAEGVDGEFRDLALLRHPAGEFEEGQPHDGIRESRHARGDARPPVDEPHGVRGAGPESAGEVVGEELGLVGGHVDVDGALALAGLAGEAEIEGLFHRLTAPAPAERVALQHFEEQARAPARRVHLLARRHVTGAHDARLRLAADADAHAAPSRLGEAGIVVSISEMGLQLRWSICGSQTQVLVDAPGPHHLSRVQFPVGIPDRFELLEGAHQVFAVHARQELRLGLAVAVLARDRPAVRHHQVDRLGYKAPNFRDALGRAQVEVDARVHASLAEVTVERALVSIPIQQLLQLAQVAAQPRGRHCRVFPALPVLGAVALARRRAETRLADLPQLARLRVFDQLHRGTALEARHQRPRFRVRLRFGLATELDQEPAVTVGQELDVLGVDALPGHLVNQFLIDALAADRPGLHHLRHVISGAEDVGIAEDEQRPAARAGDQTHRRRQHQRAGAFGPHQRAPGVKALLRQQLGEIES